jgi:acetyl esterase/lipase
VYAVRDTVNLRAHVFSPSPKPTEPLAAIIVFHGGGWHIGEAQWAFPAAQHFTRMGMVGVAAQYRLSDQKTITPLEAMADARSVIRWTRSHADSLGVDPDRIAAYGWSAGAHLATCAAIFDDADPGSQISCSPNALILESPAVSVIGDGWFRRILLGQADVRDVSPDEHVRGGLPPTLILQGDVDTVTPLAFAERFWRRMREAGNRCDLQVYEGYGHLFTPMGIADNGRPQPDQEIEADAMSRADEFLRSLGFVR